MLVVILCLCTSVDHVVRIMRVKLLFTIHNQNVKLEKDVVCWSLACELVGELILVYQECSYQLFVYSINKCFSHSVIEIAKYLIESLIIKQCGKIYLYLIFYYWGHNQGGNQVLLSTILNHFNVIVKVAAQLRTQSE